MFSNNSGGKASLPPEEPPTPTTDKFWMVYDVKTKRMHGVPLHSAQQAVDFAGRLASAEPGKAFVIMQSIAAYSAAPAVPEEVDISDIKLG